MELNKAVISNSCSITNLGYDNCPFYYNCTYRMSGGLCIYDNVNIIRQILDRNNHGLNLELLLGGTIKSGRGKLCKRIGALANEFVRAIDTNSPPIPTDIITHIVKDKAFDIYIVPLDHYHGALWKIPDGWVMFLNRNDSPFERRMTFCHELFHLLRNDSLKSHKLDIGRRNYFEEILADWFAMEMLMPDNLVEKEFDKGNSVQYMANLFGVPEVITKLKLDVMGLLPA